VTARARRRAWLEPRVRVWGIVAVVLLAIACVYTVSQLRRSSRDRWLQSNGVKVPAARVEVIGGVDQRVRHIAPAAEENPQVTLAFELDGREHKVTGQLNTQRPALLGGGATTRVPVTGPARARADANLLTIPIYVDPNDPARWTDRIEISWFEDFLIDFLLLPIVAILAVVVLVQRWRILRTWRGERANLFAVVDTQQSAAYPMSRIVRLVPHGVSRDHGVVSVVVPTRFANLDPGDLFWLIHPPERPNRGIAAALYE